MYCIYPQPHTKYRCHMPIRHNRMYHIPMRHNTQTTCLVFAQWPHVWCAGLARPLRNLFVFATTALMFGRWACGYAGGCNRIQPPQPQHLDDWQANEIDWEMETADHAKATCDERISFISAHQISMWFQSTDMEHVRSRVAALTLPSGKTQNRDDVIQTPKWPWVQEPTVK